MRFPKTHIEVDKTDPGEQIATGHQKSTSTSKSLTSATQNSKRTGSPTTLKTAHQTPTTQSPTIDEKSYNDAIKSTDTYTLIAYALVASGKVNHIFDNSFTRQSLGKEDAVALEQNDIGGDLQTITGTVSFMASRSRQVLFEGLNSSLDIQGKSLICLIKTASAILKTLEVQENKNIHLPVHALHKLPIVLHNKPLMHSAKSLHLIEPIYVVAGLNKLSLKYYNQQDVRHDQEIILPARNFSLLYHFWYHVIAWIFIQLFTHFLEERERGEPRIVVLEEELNFYFSTFFVLMRLFLLRARNYGRKVPISGKQSGGSGYSIGGMQSGNSDELLQGGQQSGGFSSGGFGGGSSGGGGGREGGDGGSDHEEGQGLESDSNEEEEEEETRRRRKKTKHKHKGRHRKPETRDEFQPPEEAQNPAPVPSPENVVAPPGVPAEMLHQVPATTHQPRLEPTSPPDDEPVEHFHELMSAETPSPQLEDPPTLQPEQCAAEGNVQPLAQAPHPHQDVADVVEPPTAAEGFEPLPQAPHPHQDVAHVAQNLAAAAAAAVDNGAQEERDEPRDREGRPVFITPSKVVRPKSDTDPMWAILHREPENPGTQFEGITMEVVAPRKDLPRPEPPSPKENAKFFCANKSASMEKHSLHGASHPGPHSSHHLDSNSNFDDSGNEHEGIYADELVSGRMDPKRDSVNSEKPHPAQEEGDVPSGACREPAPSTLSHFTQQVSQTDETVQPARIVNGEPVSEAEEGTSSSEEENKPNGQ